MTDLSPKPASSSWSPPVEVDATWVENVSTLIRDDRRGAVLNLIASLYPADLAGLMHHLSSDQAQTLFSWLPAGQAGDVLPELDDGYRGQLLEELKPSRISTLIDALDTDDAADVLADLSDQVLKDVLSRLEDAEEVEELLLYGEETAGGLMEADYVAVRADMTVAQATEEVRRLAEEVDPVYAVYVVDDAGKLLGIVHLKHLLLSREDTRIGSIMDSSIVTVDSELDQEEVARIMERRDLTVLPVVAADGRLLGRITIDDIVDVIRDEVEEDLQRLVGVSPAEELTSPVLAISRGRLVWLLVGLVGASLSALVINGFEEVIEQAVVLAMFIPVVTAMAGNVGMQSSAIAVQGLASGELWSSDVSRRLGKELLVALINAVPLSLVFGLGVVVMQSVGILDLRGAEATRLAITVALSLFTVIILAATVGATVPLVLDRFDIDPALATGPFVTTSNDILGLVVYFFVASSIYLS